MMAGPLAGLRGKLHSMKLFVILALALAMFSEAALAVCQKPPFTHPARVVLDSDAVLLVTHASSTYDTRLSSKLGIDRAVRFARQMGIPVIYLEDKTPEAQYFTADCSPDYRVFSRDGELPFEVKATHVYVVGGHLEHCLARTVEGVVNSWARQRVRDRTLTFLMDGIYTTGELIEESDPFYKDFTQFKRAIAHRRTDADPMPKLTLLETLGLIDEEETEIEFVKRALPYSGEVLTSTYEVELSLNNTLTRKIPTEPGSALGRIRFNFQDSAAKAGAL
jgi:hypothetical protein